MKNVYDVLVNFKKMPYEFYEWDKSDEINHIKKIPSFKVKDQVLYDFMNYDVNVSKEFLNQIKEKTESFCNRMVKKINYSCVIFNEDIAIAILFDDAGNILGRSKLLFDEEEDIISSGLKLEDYNIEYNVIKKMNFNSTFTRKEGKIILLLSKYLDKIYENKKNDEIKYMYFECFDEEEDNEKSAYLKLKSMVENGAMEVINKLKSLIKVLKK